METYSLKTTSSEGRAATTEPETRPVEGALGKAPLTGVEQVEVYDQVIETLHTCYDPEIPVDIYELGLIYGVKVEPSGEVDVTMTLTAPNCPAAASLPAEVKDKIEMLPRVTEAKVEITFDPPWEPSKMTEAAKLQLGMF